MIELYIFHRASRHSSYIYKHTDSPKFGKFGNNDSRMSVEKNGGLASPYVLDLYC